ncbi:MAG TPA: DeoR/GlpR family DNA-binding transcription regulator [Roseiflexaceae bacterium]|nr:DeoR/GlpR family DNA-binding transcription regulator [Roseiflexaceae bacterium]
MSTRPLSNVERQQQVLRYIEERQRVTVAGLCARFAVSEATARRDLEALEALGAIRRVHGGALAVRHAPPELPALERAREQAEEKERIGAAAAALVRDGETVFLSSGTTTLAVARRLRERSGLTVITNSLPVLNELASAPGVTLIGLGGMLRRSEMSLIGHVTELALAELRADTVIIGIRAIDIEQGLTNDYLPETMTDRAILRSGRTVMVVADHTKCGRVAPAFVAPIGAMHTLVTDAAAPRAFTAALEERGVRVVLA